MSKELFTALKNKGLTEYGSVISGEWVREQLGIEYPETGTKKQFDEVALAELGAIDYVRNILIGEGKFLASDGGDYRILLPSENKRQAEIYMSHADKKLKRALRLTKSTPKADFYSTDNTQARLVLKRESIRNQLAAVA